MQEVLSGVPLNGKSLLMLKSANLSMRALTSGLARIIGSDWIRILTSLD